jgi:very-short-patch-repair endonuclease
MDHDNSPATVPFPADPRARSLRDILMRERQALLDLSTRNRLLNLPLRTTNLRTLEIVDEKAAEVFRLLNDGKAMTFLPGVEVDVDRPFELIGPQPEDRHPAARHVDLKLQTKLASENLQKRLFDIWYDARTLEQEQGVNILYLALGLLRWYDDDTSDTPRHAPLVLLPVVLDRSNATEKFRLKGRGEPPSPNLSLQARMRADFGLTIEDFPDEDEVDLRAYAARVAAAVKPHSRWQVLPDAMVLGFFSFAKFLMYRDLDPQTWPKDAEIDDHPLIRALLHDGFAPDAPLVAEDDDIDVVLPPAERMHVVDADGSQTVAIAEAVARRSLVVKGPPGTGKSQTITNIIATAVARGKKVLFVAEKMAALDVVHRRLRQAGLGPLALELHSNKISKRTVLEELKRTKEAAAVPMPDDAGLIGQLDDSTRVLNAFAGRLHTPLQPCGLSPRDILARLARWRRAGEPGRSDTLGGPLHGARDWTAEEAAVRRDLAEDIAGRLAALGPVPAHPWRGVGAEAFDPSETDRLARDIAKMRGDLAAAAAEAGVAATLFGAPTPVTVADLDTALAYLQLTPLPRGGDRSAFTDDAWRNPNALGELIRAGEHLTQLRGRAGATFNEIGLVADYTAIRADIATKSGNLFRFLDGGYKRHIALLRSYLRGPLPKAPAERLKIADLALTLKQAEADFARLAASGAAFGALWRGADSDWRALDNVLRWRQSHERLPAAVWPRLAAATDADLTAGDRARQALYAALSAWRSGMDAVVARLDLDLGRAFGTATPAIRDLEARYAAWLDHMEQLSRFIAFASRGRRLSAMGAGAVVEAAHDGRLDHTRFLPAFDGAYAEVLRDVLFDAWPELKAFDGDGHNRRVRKFRDQDLARIALARARIAAGHSAGRPNRDGGIGPLGVLNGELAKKRAHLPLRQLLDRAGPAIQDLKPVFMMSPLSVAQFLRPGGVSFDLLVMDEASQIEPVDALGAIARARRMVVVGDERQLPPTAFFKTLTGEDAADDDEAALLRASDTESILDLCLAKGAPYRMLNWHYRSQHQSLIAVSNREFYGNQLLIVPSPFDAASGMGLRFHHLKGAWYDRGGTRTNSEEARLVAEAVIAHARRHPDQSLGVAAFSVAQRQAILRELERLRRQHPDLEPFFADDRSEPFFVKNLENIQGDERDVIFISVGYGLTKDGHLAHNFGPLSAAGGERRLNVLISRAKMRCEVFCNFTGADIDPQRSAARGVAALKLFLTFAETGHFDTPVEGAEPEAAIVEADVASALRAEGYDVRTRIGVSGFRVDVAVVDPKRPGRFVLGIDCDGAQYRDARTARDRDRLRHQVLEAHGWTIHRLWSADWYLRPREELARILAAIRGAVDIGEAEIPAPAVAPPVPSGPAGAPEVAQENPVAYREATFAIAAVEDRPVDALAGDVTRIVAIEGPVHVDEIAARVRTLSGQARLTPRLKAAVAAAVRVAQARGALAADGPFHTLPGQPVTVRDRSHVTSSGLKKPEMLPPCEIDHGIVTVIGENYGATAEDLIPAVARRLGIASTGPLLRTLIAERIDFLLRRNILTRRGGLLVAADTP